MFEAADQALCLFISFVCQVTLGLDEVKDFSCDLSDGILIRNFGLLIQPLQLTQ